MRPAPSASSGSAPGAYDLWSGDQLLQGGIVLANDDAVQTVEVTLAEGRQSSIEGLVSDTQGRPRPTSQ